MTTTVAVVGATGTLGGEVVRLVQGADDLELIARLDSTSDLSEMLGAEIVVDVTLPAVSPTIVEYAVSNGIGVLVGTSGWSGDRIAALERRLGEAPEIGVLIIPNFSLGSALATTFAAAAARFYDSIEIVEAHRAGKVDSPSGTAVRTAELIAAARRDRGPVSAPHGDQRARGQQVAGVPVHSLRLEGILAKQNVIFGGQGETLTLSHDTIDSSAYRAGILLALRAVREARGVAVGLENLIDLGIAEPLASGDPDAQNPPRDPE